MAGSKLLARTATSHSAAEAEGAPPMACTLSPALRRKYSRPPAPEMRRAAAWVRGAAAWMTWGCSPDHMGLQPEGLQPGLQSEARTVVERSMREGRGGRPVAYLTQVGRATYAHRHPGLSGGGRSGGRVCRQPHARGGDRAGRPHVSAPRLRRRHQGTVARQPEGRAREDAVGRRRQRDHLGMHMQCPCGVHMRCTYMHMHMHVHIHAHVICTCSTVALAWPPLLAAFSLGAALSGAHAASTAACRSRG